MTAIKTKPETFSDLGRRNQIYSEIGDIFRARRGQTQPAINDQETVKKIVERGSDRDKGREKGDRQKNRKRHRDTECTVVWNKQE